MNTAAAPHKSLVFVALSAAQTKHYKNYTLKTLNGNYFKSDSLCHRHTGWTRVLSWFLSVQRKKQRKRQQCQNNLNSTDMAVIFICEMLEQFQELDNKGWSNFLMISVLYLEQLLVNSLGFCMVIVCQIISFIITQSHSDKKKILCKFYHSLRKLTEIWMFYDPLKIWTKKVNFVDESQVEYVIWIFPTSSNIIWYAMVSQLSLQS